MVFEPIDVEQQDKIVLCFLPVRGMPGELTKLIAISRDKTLASDFEVPQIVGVGCLAFWS